MTQAFNLSQLANNLNTSGQLDATDGLTGSVPVANGGTGQTTLTSNAVLLGNGTGAVQAVAPSTSGNLLVSNGTTWVSQAPSGGGVTSLNGQTGSITNTDVNAIGSYVGGAVSVANTTYNPGATVSGSSLQQYYEGAYSSNWYSGGFNLSRTGTYRAMNRSMNGGFNCCGDVLKRANLWVRIS